MKHMHPADESGAPRVFQGAFPIVWLCGWVVVQYVLWTSIFGVSKIPWQGRQRSAALEPDHLHRVLDVAGSVGDPQPDQDVARADLRAACRLKLAYSASGLRSTASSSSSESAPPRRWIVLSSLSWKRFGGSPDPLAS